MTKKNLTEIAAILDRSGSMMVVKTDTEGAFNAYVAEQRGVEGDAKLTLVQFDTKIEMVYDSKPLDRVPPLQLNPGGMTALYDAIGITVTKFGERLSDMDEDQRPEHVIVLILTDGLENSSKEWTKAALKKLIKEQVDKWNWTFLYLGANQDAVFEGGEIGIDAGTSLTYDVGSMDVTIASASAATTRSRMGKSAGFTEAERGSAVAVKKPSDSPMPSSSTPRVTPPAGSSKPRGTRPPGAKPTIQK